MVNTTEFKPRKVQINYTVSVFIEAKEAPYKIKINILGHGEYV